MNIDFTTQTSLGYWCSTTNIVFWCHNEQLNSLILVIVTYSVSIIFYDFFMPLDWNPVEPSSSIDFIETIW